MKFIVGAYASAPSTIRCKIHEEIFFYENLVCNDDLIGGLEIPFLGEDINKFGELILNY